MFSSFSSSRKRKIFEKTNERAENEKVVTKKITFSSSFSIFFPLLSSSFSSSRKRKIFEKTNERTENEKVVTKNFFSSSFSICFPLSLLSLLSSLLSLLFLALVPSFFYRSPVLLRLSLREHYPPFT